MDKIILVIYINCSGMSNLNYDRILSDIKMSLPYNSTDILTYIIPISEGLTRVECVNPKLVTEDDFKKAKQILDEIEQKLNSLIEK